MADEGEWVQSLDRIGEILLRWYVVHLGKKADADDKGRDELHTRFHREFLFIIRRLSEEGFSHYVSANLNYARPGNEKGGKVVAKRIRTLTEILVKDIAKRTKKESLTAGDIVPHSAAGTPWDESLPKPGPRYDRFHELVNEWREIISTRDENRVAFKGKKFSEPEGRRVPSRKDRVISTPYSGPKLVDKWNGTVSFVARFLQNPGTRQAGLQLAHLMGEGSTHVLAVSSVEKAADPIEMRKIMAFQSHLEALLAENGLKLPPAVGVLEHRATARR